jgi:hypothetical protein
MVKTQVQFPDELYRQLKRVAREREMSFAEVVRRGAERIVQSYPPLDVSAGEWKLPGPFDVGGRSDPFADPNWRVDANLGSGAAALVRERTGRYKARKRFKR